MKKRTQDKSTTNLWKAKAIERGKENRKLTRRFKLKNAQCQKWKTRCEELEKSKKLDSVKFHHYPLQLIWLGVWMHIKFNISLRGVSKSLVKMGELLGLQIQYISPSTVRNWCLKFGLHCLNQPIKKGEYVLICDESVEIGKEHLMLALAVPIEKSSRITPLKMEDVRVLDLAVQSSWKSVELQKMLNDKIKQWQLSIQYGISDNCNVLKKAFKSCQVAHIADCTHEMANVSKSLFKKNESFNTFIKRVNQLRSKWIISKNHIHCPPCLRSKSRFHATFALSKWVDFIKSEWKGLTKEAKKELSFINQNKTIVNGMKNLYYLIETFSKIFKSEGIHNSSIQKWKKSVDQYKSEQSVSRKARQFIKRMNIYLDKQKEQLPDCGQILCCSDVIESIFGKYKNKGGAKIMTDDVLKIAAYPVNIKLEEVKNAMEQNSISILLKWKKENTTTSKLAFFKAKKNAEK